MGTQCTCRASDVSDQGLSLPERRWRRGTGLALSLAMMFLAADPAEACENSPGGCWQWGVHELSRAPNSIQSEVTVLSGEGSVAFTEELYSLTDPCPSFGCVRAFSESMRHGRAEVAPVSSDIATLVRRSDPDGTCPLINKTRDVVSGPNTTRRNFGFLGSRTIETTYTTGTGLPDLPVSGPLTAFPLFGNVGTGTDDTCLQVSGTSWHTPTPIPPVEETFRGQSGFSWNPATGSVILEDLASQNTIPTTWSTALSIAPQGGFVAGCAATNTLSNFIPGNPPIFNIFPFPTVAPVSGPWVTWHASPGCLTDITVDGGVTTVVGHAGPDAIWGSVPFLLTNLGQIDPTRQYRVSVTPNGDALVPSLDLSTTVHLDGGGSFTYNQRFVDLGLPGFFVNPSAVSDDLWTVGGHDGPEPRMANLSPIRVAALGDSYSSGVGVGNPYTGGNCFRSVGAYSHFPNPRGTPDANTFVALAAALPDFEFEFHACSGAQTPQIPAQSAAAGPSDLIILSIGGNDIGEAGGAGQGFSRIITHCVIKVFNDDCFDEEFEETNMTLREWLNPQPPVVPPIEVAKQNVLNTMTTLRATGATVLLLGYPDVTEGRSCNTISAPEAVDLQQLVRDLNAAMSEAAEEAGVYFRVPNFAGHGVCSGRGVRWVNFISGVFGFGPRQESFHPNGPGHRLGYAPVIQDFLRDGFDRYSRVGLPLNPQPQP